MAKAPKCCWVPRCLTILSNTSDKNVTFFSPPSAPGMLDKWRKSIPRTDRVLSRGDIICEKHFEQQFLKTNIGSRVEDDNEQLRSKLHRKLLTPDAVPTLFPAVVAKIQTFPFRPAKMGTPAYGSRVIPDSPEQSRTRKIGFQSKTSRMRKTATRAVTLAKNQTLPVRGAKSRAPAYESEASSPVPDTPEQPPTTPMLDVLPDVVGVELTPIVYQDEKCILHLTKKRTERNTEVFSSVLDRSHLTEIASSSCHEASTPSVNELPGGIKCVYNEIDFMHLWTNVALVQLPNLAWTGRSAEVDGRLCVLFHEFAAGNDGQIGARKWLSWDREHGVRAYVFNSSVVLPKSGNVGFTSVVTLANHLLELFHRIPVCAGQPSRPIYEGLQPTKAYLDDAGAWRSKACPLLITPDANLCDRCKNLNDYLANFLRRNKRKGSPGPSERNIKRR